MRSSLFDVRRRVAPPEERYVLQNAQLLEVRLGPDVIALKGSMVAFEGPVEFAHQSAGGVGRLVKRVLSGENTPLMRASGNGSVYFANDAHHVFLVHLEGDALGVNGTSLLAFDADLDWDIERVKGASVWSQSAFNTRLRGHGTVALTAGGEPVLFDCSNPIHVDVRAAVAWSSTVEPKLVPRREGAGRRDSGEDEQYVFRGDGFVVVQPSERRPGKEPGQDGGSGDDDGGFWDWLGDD